jgi:hypothetical protein
MKLDPEALGLKQVSKKEPAPATIIGEDKTACPVCMDIKLTLVKPCCGSPKGSRVCRRCGYKEIVR